MVEIKKVFEENNQAKKYEMADGRILTPAQVAGLVDSGVRVIYKGQEVHSVEGEDGKHIRSNPDGRPRNNLVQK